MKPESVQRKACELMDNGNVTARVAGLRSAAERRTGITQDKVLAELAKIGFADLRKAVKWGEGIAVTDDDGNTTISNGVSLVGSEDLDDSTAAAISEISQTAQGIKIKLHDKRAALVDIGRHLGMFTDKVEHSGGIEVTQIVRKIVKV
jgi:phage terminase small subunit